MVELFSMIMIPSLAFSRILLVNFSDFSNEEVICSFEIKDERYLFRTNLNSTRAELLLNLPYDIYQLQRRNNFRVMIPAAVSYVCTIRSVNFAKTNIKAELRDLSMGGCLVILQNADKLNIPKDSEVEMSLKLNEFDTPSIKTEAKHLRPVESNNTLQIGLQYLDPSADFLSELQNLLMQLDRIQRGKNLD